MASKKERRGGGGVFARAQATGTRRLHSARWRAELRTAIETGGLLLHYQPLVSTDSGQVTGMEALARWQHPEKGLIPPDRFIRLAEQTGLIVPLADWVLDAALNQCRIWNSAGRDLGVQVNLSMRNLRDWLLPQRIQGLLQVHNVDPWRLTLEITESDLMTDPARTLEVLAGLAAIGVRLSIDDFGTGYASLSYLARLPVHQVKLDRALLQQMEREQAEANEKGRAIVQSTIAMAHAIGLEVVAEGIETREVCELLARYAERSAARLLSRPAATRGGGTTLDGRIFLSAANAALRAACSVAANPGEVSRRARLNADAIGTPSRRGGISQ